MAHKVFTDSYNYLVSDILNKWTSKTGTMSINPTGGRRSSPALRCGAEAGANIVKSIPTSACVAMGTNIKVPSNHAWDTTYTVLFAVYDSSGYLNCFLTLNSSRGIEVYRNAYGHYGTGSMPVLLGSSSAEVIPLDVDTYIEWGVKLSNSAGTIEVKVNGSDVVIPLTSSLDTVYNGEHAGAAGYGTVNNGYGNGDKAWTTKCGIDYCDSYIAYGDEVAFKGDCKVRKLVLTGDAVPQDWTPSSGNAWERMNVGDGSLTGSAVGATSLFDFADISDNSSLIQGVQVLVKASKSDAGVKEIAVVAKHNSSEVESDVIALGTSAAYYSRFFHINPSTSQPWTQSELNATKLGVRVKT